MSDETRYIHFDGLTWPLVKSIIAVEVEEGPFQGIGVTWDTIDGQQTATVEFKLRGADPIHITIVEDEDGTFEVVLPEMKFSPRRTTN